MHKKSIIFSMLVVLFLASCGSRELVDTPPQKTDKVSYPTKGLMHFMYGEIYRAEGNYVYANLEYRRALEYDTTATILKAIGESYRRLGKHKLATGYYEKALKLDPEDENAHYNVVDLYMKELRYEEAIPMLKEYLEKEPGDSDYLQRLAESYRGIGEKEKALEAIDQLIDVAPQYPWPYIYAAEIMLELGTIADAAPYLEKVARKIPPNNELYEFWVRSLFASNNIDGMLSALEFWLAQDPDILAPYFLYIDYTFQNGDFEKANKTLDKIRHRWQEDGRISYFLGISSMENGNGDSVMYYFDRAEESGDTGIDLYMNYGLWFWETGNLEQAEHIADRAIAMLGPGTRWLHMKAMINAQKKDWGKAEVLLLQIVEVDSGNTNAKEDLANIYVEIGNCSQVKYWYEALLKDYPGNSSYLNNYAYALARLNSDLNKAMKMINEALKIEKSAAYLDTKAWILYRQQKYNKALTWVNRSLKYPGAGAEVHYHRAMILLALEKKEEAILAFKASLQIDPGYEKSIKALEEIK